jgi:hypothetical protein
VRRGRLVTLHASPQELHVDDDPWQAESAAEAAAPSGGQQAEVTIAVGQTAIEVLVAG